MPYAGKTAVGLAILLLMIACGGNGADSTPTSAQQPQPTPQPPSTIPSNDPQIQLVGYPELKDFGGAPLHDTVWKAFRVRATTSGSADVFRMFLWGFDSGQETNNEVGFAVYEDDDGKIGSLMVSGHIARYDWTVVGIEQYHSFVLDEVHTTRAVSEGKDYWLTFQASGGSNVLISRGTQSTCDNNEKRGTNSNAVGCCERPPTPGELSSVTYGNNCYGWAVWQSASTN